MAACIAYQIVILFPVHTRLLSPAIVIWTTILSLRVCVSVYYVKQLYAP